MASVAVCSSMFNSWHNVSKLLRIELSSILPDSESDDSSPRIRTNIQLHLQTSLKPPRSSVRSTKTRRHLRPQRNNTNQQLPHGRWTSAYNPHNAAHWRQNFREMPNQRRGELLPRKLSTQPPSLTVQSTVTRQPLLHTSLIRNYYRLL